eukprot:PhF_6_TR28076/c1_g1_i1/m.41475
MWNSLTQLKAYASEVVAPKYVPTDPNAVGTPSFDSEGNADGRHDQPSTTTMTKAFATTDAVMQLFGDNDDDDDGTDDASTIHIKTLRDTIRQQQSQIETLKHSWDSVCNEAVAICSQSIPLELLKDLRYVLPVLGQITGRTMWKEIINVLPSIPSTLAQREQQWIETYQKAAAINLGMAEQIKQLQAGNNNTVDTIEPKGTSLQAETEKTIQAQVQEIEKLKKQLQEVDEALNTMADTTDKEMEQLRHTITKLESELVTARSDTATKTKELEENKQETQITNEALQDLGNEMEILSNTNRELQLKLKAYESDTTKTNELESRTADLA